MRKTMLSLSAVVCLFFAGAARADSLYSLLLTSTSGNAGNGTGSIELLAAPPSTGLVDYNLTNGLEALSFTIGGDTFTLANSTGNLDVRFIGGALNSILYAGHNTQGTVSFSISSAGLVYNFSNSLNTVSGTGNITDPAPRAEVAHAPEPSSFILLGTSLFAGAGVFRRRRA